MFTINTSFKSNEKPLTDWFIVVNGKKCKCNKSIAEQISPIVKDFNQDVRNRNKFFATEIKDNLALLDSSTDLLSPICVMVSKIFCGEEIICQKNNFSILLLIGTHFKIQEIINKTEEYNKYLETISFHFKDSLDFNDMLEIERILLFAINETNIETIIKENEGLIKKIPINCLIHFVINICLKKCNNITLNPSEFVVEIIQNVDKIVPETISYFKSIMFNEFVLKNSYFFNDINSHDKIEINSLIYQMLVDGLISKKEQNKKIYLYEITIPEELEKLFMEKGIFLKLSNKFRTQNKEEKSELDTFLDLIKNDDIESFQNYIVCFKVDINYEIKNDITNRIFFIDNDKECSLIELSAFYGSIKCFMYLYNQQAVINKSRLGNFAVSGGNPEIIHICEREECVFNDRTLDISIEYHKHQITKWLVETKNITESEYFLKNSIIYYNIKTMKYFIKRGLNITKIMIYICESGNDVLFRWLVDLLKKYFIKIECQENNKTVLHIACEQNNVEIVQSLILNDIVDINSILDVNIRKNEFFIL